MSSERKFTSLKNGTIWNPRQDADKKEATPNENSFIEGIYISHEEGQGKDANSRLYKIEAHVVDGKPLKEPEEYSAWGAHILDDQMDRVKPGSYIRIKWLGKKQPKGTGRPFHDWEVGVDRNYVPAANNTAVKEQAAAPVVQNKVASTPPVVPPPSNEPAEESDDLPF